MSTRNRRLKSLQRQLKLLRLDALLITSQPNIYYLTGITPMPDTNELTALATKNELYIFVRATYFKEAKRLAKLGSIWEVSSCINTSEVAEGTPRGWRDKDTVKKTRGVDKTSLSCYIKTLIKRQHFSTIGFEAANITVSTLNTLKSQISPKNISWKTTKNLIEKLRQIKDKTEIAYIKQAAKVTDEAFSFILDKIKPGKREKDIALEIEMYLKTMSDGIAFSPIVASGKNSANPHYISGEKRIKKGEMVLLDFGARVAGYCADLTRVVFIGKASKKFKKVYQTVLDTQEKTLESLLKGNNSINSVDHIARSYIKNHGYPNIPHGLGHCLGLDIHELPRIATNTKNTIKPGMVFTIEPGIYLPCWGGVRIEDLVAWIPKEGIKILSKSPKNLIEL